MSYRAAAAYPPVSCGDSWSVSGDRLVVVAVLILIFNEENLHAPIVARISRSVKRNGLHL